MRLLLISLLVAIANIGLCQTGPSFTGGSPSLPPTIPQHLWRGEGQQDVTMLQSGVIQDVYIAVGYVVYLSFPKETPIEQVYVGASSMVTADVAAEQNSIALNAQVMKGSTNMTVVLRGKPYAFTIHIVSSGDIKYTLAYTLPSLQVSPDEVPANFGPPLAPQSIQVQKYIQAIENMHLKTRTPLQNEMRSFSLNKLYTWGHNSIILDAAFCFPSDNMLVLKIVRKNLGKTASYLSAQQITACIANNRFPSTLAMQMNEMLFPGQSEYIYLFLQGFNLVARNNFELSLPPAPENVSRMQ